MQLDQILSTIFQIATGACIGLALGTNPVIGGIALAGIGYNIYKIYRASHE